MQLERGKWSLLHLYTESTGRCVRKDMCVGSIIFHDFSIGISHDGCVVVHEEACGEGYCGHEN